MPNIIRDTLPMGTTMIPIELAKTLKKHGIPVFKGKLFKHDGPMNQNLDDWGNPIFTHVNDNTVVLGGAVLALRYLFDNASGFMPPSLNSIFDCNNLSEEELNAVYNKGNRSSVKLFGVGTGGASAEKFGDVKDPDFKQKQLVDWIPFRISDTPVLTGSTGDDVSKYYFRRKFATSPTVQYGWYLKEFENATNVPIISRWKDTIDSTGTGSEIDSDISEDTSGNLIETYGECMIKITADDIRPYFVFNGDLAMARYNTIGLFTGVKTTLTGTGNAADNRVNPETYSDYVDVRLFSVVNMDNVSVKIPSETTYLYRIYAAV